MEAENQNIPISNLSIILNDFIYCKSNNSYYDSNNQTLVLQFLGKNQISDQCQTHFQLLTDHPELINSSVVQFEQWNIIDYFQKGTNFIIIEIQAISHQKQYRIVLFEQSNDFSHKLLSENSKRCLILLKKNILRNQAMNLMEKTFPANLFFQNISKGSPKAIQEEIKECQLQIKEIQQGLQNANQNLTNHYNRAETLEKKKSVSKIISESHQEIQLQEYINSFKSPSKNDLRLRDQMNRLQDKIDKQDLFQYLQTKSQFKQFKYAQKFPNVYENYPEIIKRQFNVITKAFLPNDQQNPSKKKCYHRDQIINLLFNSNDN